MQMDPLGRADAGRAKDLQNQNTSYNHFSSLYLSGF